MISELHKRVRELFEEGKVEVVIGYEAGTDKHHTRPAFIDSVDEVDKLVWNNYCVHNLSRYLYEPDIVYRAVSKEVDGRRVTELVYKKVGIVAKGCDVRSIVLLAQENKVKRENVFIIGMPCEGMIDISRGDGGAFAKCKVCQVHTPREYDILIGDPVDVEPQTDILKELDEVSQRSAAENSELWNRYLERCILCRACRNVCPSCYCKDYCVIDKIEPQWVDPSPTVEHNRTYQLIRIFHMVGRCVDCGECERACPMNIPIRELLKRINGDIFAAYGYMAGMDMRAAPPAMTYKPEDPGDFIM
ncbi:MAG: 4Fe-4S dicluster domain-containing protein [bacterium]